MSSWLELTRMKTAVLGKPMARNTDRHCDPNSSIGLLESLLYNEFAGSTNANKSATYVGQVHLQVPD